MNSNVVNLFRKDSFLITFYLKGGTEHEVKINVSGAKHWYEIDEFKLTCEAIKHLFDQGETFTEFDVLSHTIERL